MIQLIRLQLDTVLIVTNGPAVEDVQDLVALFVIGRPVVVNPRLWVGRSSADLPARASLLPGAIEKPSGDGMVS